MNTKILKLNTDEDRRNAIREASECLARGGLVVFPTETVYGIGACATNPDAMHRLRHVKERQEEKPFTVHIGSRSQVRQFVPKLQGVGLRLTEKAWPGPLTLIFHVDEVESAPVIRDSSAEHAQAMYYDGTIGIRCPDDRIAAELLTTSGVPVVAASANPAGAPAPVEAEETLGPLTGKVDLILDAGRTRYAKASTIVRVNGDGYHIVREGVLDERTIRRLTNVNFLLVCSGNTCRSPMAAGLLRHLLAERMGCTEQELAEKGFQVESAGVTAYGGSPPASAGVQALLARGIDISGHRSQPLTPELVHRADHIFTMTASHLSALSAFGQSARERARLVDEQDIEDPIGESEAVYAQCADQIEKALRRRLQEIPL